MANAVDGFQLYPLQIEDIQDVGFGPSTDRAVYQNMIWSKLPKNIAIIGTICLIALSALAIYAAIFVLNSGFLGILVGGFGVLGMFKAVKNIHRDFLQSDRLVQTFYNMVGGRQNFENLPTYAHSGKIDLLSHHLRSARWDDINDPIQKAYTADGRHVMIVKCNLGYRTLCVFVEKLNSSEAQDPRKNSLLKSVFRCFRVAISVLVGNLFHEYPAEIRTGYGNAQTAWISPTMNEYMATNIQRILMT